MLIANNGGLIGTLGILESPSIPPNAATMSGGITGPAGTPRRDAPAPAPWLRVRYGHTAGPTPMPTTGTPVSCLSRQRSATASDGGSFSCAGTGGRKVYLTGDKPVELISVRRVPPPRRCERSEPDPVDEDPAEWVRWLLPPRVDDDGVATVGAHDDVVDSSVVADDDDAVLEVEARCASMDDTSARRRPADAADSDTASPRETMSRSPAMCLVSSMTKTGGASERSCAAWGGAGLAVGSESGAW